MDGFITTYDLLAHPAIIIREFGVRCYLRCLNRAFLSKKRVTFLECIECTRRS